MKCVAWFLRPVTKPGDSVCDQLCLELSPHGNVRTCFLYHRDLTVTKKSHSKSGLCFMSSPIWWNRFHWTKLFWTSPKTNSIILLLLYWRRKSADGLKKSPD